MTERCAKTKAKKKKKGHATKNRPDKFCENQPKEGRNRVSKTIWNLHARNYRRRGHGERNDIQRHALFRMARHPSCKKNHDKSGDTQMLEYTYLAFNHPKKVALLKSSLERPDHADWETRIGQEEACKLHARIAKMR